VQIISRTMNLLDVKYAEDWQRQNKNICWDIISYHLHLQCRIIIQEINMEQVGFVSRWNIDATSFSETSLCFQRTRRCCITEDRILHNQCCENSDPTRAKRVIRATQNIYVRLLLSLHSGTYTYIYVFASLRSVG
jgi:hypothetical protein